MARETMIVTGKAFYASVHRPNKGSGKYAPKYEVQVVVDADTEAKLLKRGLKKAVHKDKDTGLTKFVSFEGTPGAVFKFYMDTATRDGSPQAPSVVDAAGKPTKVLVGNGSVINASINVFDYTNGAGGTSSRLNGIQIVELVPYEPKGRDLFKPTKGFVDNNAGASDDGSEII